MTESERAMMLRHVAYWTELVERGVAVAFGPVADPRGGYGIGIVELEDNADVYDLEKNDPTVESGLGFTYEIFRMPQAVLRPSHSASPPSANSVTPLTSPCSC